MDENKPTQKQISDRYAGAVDYLRRAHYFRTLRSRLFLATVVVSILTAIAFSYLGEQNAYSPGPISQNHLRFTNDCRVCHTDSDESLWQRAKRALGASTPHGTDAAGARAKISFNLMDAACLKCHPNEGLHLPQTANLAVRTVSNALTEVHATNCATCHREHVSHDRMALPTQQACVACHNSADELTLARHTVKFPGTPVAPTGENRKLEDGVVRFLTPARAPGSLKPFPHYAAGHPPFNYEQPGLQDPGLLKFRHDRHLSADFPKVNNTSLACTTCHQPGPGGAFFQTVKYEKHCMPCHTLNLQARSKMLTIPHGDPEKVRLFLTSLESSLDLALRPTVSNPTERAKSVQSELQPLANRGLNNLPALEQLVFFDGDPKDDPRSRLMRGSQPKSVTECKKCHDVKPGDPSHAPKVQPPNMAERWVQHGPFTHLPHQHMRCIDCHAASETSAASSDILLPAQATCAKCHRPPKIIPIAAGPNPAGPTAFPRSDVAVAVKAQCENGGIKWDCTSCHGFHAPSDAESIIKTIASPPKPPAKDSGELIPAAGRAGQ